MEIEMLFKSQDREMHELALVLLGYDETEASFQRIKNIVSKYNVHLYIRYADDYNLDNVAVFYLGSLIEAKKRHDGRIQKGDT